MRWELKPRGFFGRDFVILGEDGQPLTEIDTHVNWFGEDSRFTLEGIEYSLQTKGLTGGRFDLVRDRRTLAHARRSGLWDTSLEVELADRRFKLKRVGFWGTRFELRHGDHVCGGIQRKGWSGRTVLFDMSERIPLAEQVFIAWLALILWTREDSAAATVAASV